MDIILFLLWAIYCMITAVAVVMTIREYLRSGRRELHWAFMGLLACLIWPVMVAVAVLSTRRHPDRPLESERS
jgi:hypothetical protein